LERAEALRKYMEMTKELNDQKIHKLIIESCGMKDMTFALLLDGVISQAYLNPSTGLL